MADTKTRLTLTQCSVGKDGTVSADGKTFTVTLNPAEFKREHSITYNRRRTLGQSGLDPKFNAINPDRVAFSIVLDGTGAVPGAAQKDVKDQITDLLSVVYNYNGDKHEPNHVRVLWGTLIFFGRLERMSTDYTIFKASGDPLRAKVQLSFCGFMSKSEEQLVANRSSPDLSHIIVVRAGDTLPHLCNAVYGDPSYYPEVARVNDLVGFRSLEPGQALHFPPLDKG